MSILFLENNQIPSATATSHPRTFSTPSKVYEPERALTDDSDELKGIAVVVDEDRRGHEKITHHAEN